MVFQGNGHLRECHPYLWSLWHLENGEWHDSLKGLQGTQCPPRRAGLQVRQRDKRVLWWHQNDLQWNPGSSQMRQEGRQKEDGLQEITLSNVYGCRWKKSTQRIKPKEHLLLPNKKSRQRSALGSSDLTHLSSSMCSNVSQHGTNTSAPTPGATPSDNSIDPWSKGERCKKSLLTCLFF